METMDPKKIQFKYSNKGTPYIQIGYMGKLIFSKITSHPEKGYKFMCFSHQYIDNISIKNTTGKRKIVKVPTNESYTTNMYLQRESKNGNKKPKGLPHNTLPGRMKDYLKKIFNSLLDEEGYLPYEKIDILKKKIHNKNIKTILSKVQKKRKSRKKKST